jgi:hypothetical protein
MNTTLQYFYIFGAVSTFAVLCLAIIVFAGSFIYGDIDKTPKEKLLWAFGEVKDFSLVLLVVYMFLLMSSFGFAQTCTRMERDNAIIEMNKHE